MALDDDGLTVRARYRARAVRPAKRGVVMAQFLRVAWLVMRKDLTVEIRSREIVYTTLFFAVSCVLVFAFALREGRAAGRGRGGRASCGSPSPSRARWRSGARSSASATPRRCAR